MLTRDNAETMRRLRGRSAGAVPAWWHECDACGGRAPMALSPTAARRRAIEAGWMVDDGVAVCPVCRCLAAAWTD